MSQTKAPDPTGKPQDRRKLVAIVYADMVGYSRLIGLDDVGTLNRLRALRREVIDPTIEEHGGRIVQTGGDSLLIVFDSHIAQGLIHLVVTYYFERDYLKASEVAKRAVATYPDFPTAIRWLAASLGQLGHLKEARTAMQRLLELSPQSIDLYIRSHLPWLRPEDYEHLLDGLRKAGWEGGSVTQRD